MRRDGSPGGMPWVAVVAVLAALSSGCGASDPAASDTRGADATASPTPGRREGNHDDRGLDAPASRPAASAAAALVSRFARAWVRRDLPAATWWRRLSPMCTDELAYALRSTEPANVPASGVTGAPVKRRGGESPMYTVATDAGSLSVTVSVRAEGWRVSDIDFARKVAA